MSTVWEDTDGCSNQYSCALGIYLMAVLSSSYVIIMDSAVNTPGHEKNFVYELNATYTFNLKGKTGLFCKLAINNTSNIGMLLSASKYVHIIFTY